MVIKMTNIVKIKNLSKFYGKKAALNNLSLNIEKEK